MKCLRNKLATETEIIRVSNAEADRLVNQPLGHGDGKAWVYTTKNAWRAHVRKPLVAAAE